jgi:hypothetical protein
MLTQHKQLRTDKESKPSENLTQHKGLRTDKESKLQTIGKLQQSEQNLQTNKGSNNKLSENASIGSTPADQQGKQLQIIGKYKLSDQQ